MTSYNSYYIERISNITLGNGKLFLVFWSVIFEEKYWYLIYGTGETFISYSLILTPISVFQRVKNNSFARYQYVSSKIADEKTEVNLSADIQ